MMVVTLALERRPLT